MNLDELDQIEKDVCKLNAAFAQEALRQVLPLLLKPFVNRVSSGYTFGS
jgi:hypothetical protein